MKNLHILPILLASFLMTSCMSEYHIAGKSTVPVLDGKMLTLRTASVGTTTTRDLDSCQVIHGKFSFYGDVDTICMAQIYFGSENIMPLVIENTDLYISLDNIGQRVTGGPLNEKLYKYLNQQKKLYNEWNELQTSYINMVRSGKSSDYIQKKLGDKFRKNAEKSEKLETKFIIENADNVLGPGYFMILCNQYPIPVITDQINEILESVPPSFLQNFQVRNYIEQAKFNPLSKTRLTKKKK